MGRLSVFFNSRKLILVPFLVVTSYTSIYSQGNCLIYPEESGERIACELSYRAVEYRQGSRESQLLFDAAIEIGPKYAWGYYEKSVPFFKRGLLNEGVRILNKAIALEPKRYLSYRAYWYFSHQSYSACIADLERYYVSLNGPMDFTPGGDMEMKMLLGLAYAQTANLIKGIAVVQDRIDTYQSEAYVGSYDYHVLGVLHFDNRQLEEAARAFEKQIELNEYFADSYYYLGLIKRYQGEEIEAQRLLQESLDRFEGRKGGHSFSGFLDYNVNKDDVQSELAKVGS